MKEVTFARKTDSKGRIYVPQIGGWSKNNFSYLLLEKVVIILTVLGSSGGRKLQPQVFRILIFLLSFIFTDIFHF